MDSGLRVGIVQHDPLVGDVAGNAERIAHEYEHLDPEPSLVVTPELALVGYPPRDLLHRSGVLDAQRAALDALAERTADGPPLVVGATVRTDHETGPPLHNAAVVLRDGERAATYHKRLLPTYDVFDEHRYYRPGGEPTVVTVDGVEVGLTVCEDAWHDAVVTGQRRHSTDPLAETAAAGADLILTLSASPFSLDKPARREERFLGHAARTDCPVVFANQVGGNDELIFDGHSFVADGSVQHRLSGFEPETAVVDVPLDDSGKSLPRYERSPAEQARAALGLGISDYFGKTGFDEAVIGMSGGIDSSVAATLAADALGTDSVYGVSLPSTVTSQQSVDDARAIAENLGIGFDVIPVGPAVETVREAVDENATRLTGVALENLQARVRGDVLMSLANERDALVLTPDNKSEAAVGYCTMYGDTVGALAPLGDCQKWLVYDLAAAFNHTTPADTTASSVIPDSVVEKAPTAELSEGQTDADDLPPYEQLDPVLQAYIERTPGGAGLREEYPDEVVDGALSRVTRAEFKRRQTPPPLRVTQKALGRGWNYPVAAAYDHVLDRE
ncbi:MAG: NAD+ synthetase [halophilic archaeon J07HX64]|jgi:NAD+ synthetase|nr:MAG: NAD+ synthetase [halophilic archaeon J07HX64]